MESGSGSDDPFRNAPARPPALVALAEAATSAPVHRADRSDDALRVPDARVRVALALGVPIYRHGEPARRLAAVAIAFAVGAAISRK
jgi:hypothetical protein